MDPLTHALSGILLARASEPRTAARALRGRPRLYVMLLATLTPDADIVLLAFDPLLYLNEHRGVTHSLLMLPLWAWLLAGLAARIFKPPGGWRACYGVCTLGLIAHLVLDVITSYGTQLLAPFSHWRAMLPISFIIDPWFTLLLFIGVVMGTPRARAVLVIAGFYVVMEFALYQRALDVVARVATTPAGATPEVQALAQPFSPFNWKLLISDPARHRLAYLNLAARAAPQAAPADATWPQRLLARYRPAQTLVWEDHPRLGAPVSTLARAVWNDPAFAAYRRFAVYPALLRVDEVRGCAWFTDLRFGLPELPSPFRYGLCRDSASFQLDHAGPYSRASK